MSRLTGYRQTSADRLSCRKPVKNLTLYSDGGVVKLKPEKSVRRTARGSGFTLMGSWPPRVSSGPSSGTNTPETKFPQNPWPAYAATDGRYRPMASLSPRRGNDGLRDGNHPDNPGKVSPISYFMAACKPASALVTAIPADEKPSVCRCVFSVLGYTGTMATGRLIPMVIMS
jgi:hypothetical protein